MTSIPPVQKFTLLAEFIRATQPAAPYLFWRGGYTAHKGRYLHFTSMVDGVACSCRVDCPTKLEFDIVMSRLNTLFLNRLVEGQIKFLFSGGEDN